MHATDGFSFDVRPGTIRVGTGCVDELGAELGRRGLGRALLVAGRTVGTTPAVVDPIRAGVGDRLVGEFPETTPDKTLGTALAGLRAARAHDADAVVAVGGGSTLDTAKVLCALSTHGDSAAQVAEEAVETGHLPVGSGDSLPVESGDPLPMIAVPTTLAGADLSDMAGITLTLDREVTGNGDPPSGGVRDPRLMPTALFYDADRYRTTPTPVLAASAMNGFDKGVEMLYSPLATPITDGTAARGLGLLRSGLGTVRDDPMDGDRLADVLAGIVAVQYGLAGAEGYRASIIHAFGHGFSHGYDVHQGTIHAIVAPHVLRYVFDRVDGRRDLLASALGVAGDGDPAEATIDAVAGVRDDLGLPTRLRDLDGVEWADLPSTARAIRDDDLLGVAPAGIDPSADEIESVLDRAW